MRIGDQVFGLRILTNFAKLSLVLLLIHFSQIYPYVHFHHSHTEADDSADFHHHVVAEESDHSHEKQHSHHHETSGDTEKNKGHDQHHEYTEHVDWHLVRLYSDDHHVTIEIPLIPDSWICFSESLSTEGLAVPESVPIPDSAPRRSINPRAPPRSI